MTPGANDLAAFRELGLSETTLAALEQKGFVTPTPIQALTIPRLLSGERDLIGQAQTGTGKTAAFALPILEQVQADKITHALVLAPTRELGLQIADEIRSMTGGRKVRTAAFYGGAPIEYQLAELKKGVEIVIGTPGRILDLLKRGVLKLDQLQFAVLDEADEMLDMGFLDDIKAILQETNAEKRMLMFSATMPEPILAVAKEFMRDYEVVRAETETAPTELADQFCYCVRREDKFAALSRILDMDPEIYALIFCRTRTDVDELAERLKMHRFRAEALHGEIPQTIRLKIISSFKEKKFRLLVATDVAARGIDVTDLTHVINYSLPFSPEIYIHRIGRTGRAGKRGTAITFATPGESRRLELIRKEAHAELRTVPLPTGEDVVEAKKQRFLEMLAETTEANDYQPYLNFAEELLTMTDSPADLLAAMLRLKFKDALLPETYPEIGPSKRPARKTREDFRDVPGSVRIFIGVGKDDGYGAVKILDLLWEKAHIRKSRIGKIDCFDKFTFLDMMQDDAEQLMAACCKSGPRVQLAAEGPAKDAKAERAPRPEEKAEKKKKTPPAKQKRQLKAWVDKLCAEVDKTKKRRSKKSRID